MSNNVPKIIISPFSRQYSNGLNAKNYHRWAEVTTLLRQNGFYTIQIGLIGEDGIGADEQQFSLKFSELKCLVRECTTWCSIDNFFHHFCVIEKKPGVCLFSLSDPLIFGHSLNTNLLKDRKYLRSNQFDWWRVEHHNPDAFVEPIEVLEAIKVLIGKNVY